MSDRLHDRLADWLREAPDRTAGLGDLPSVTHVGTVEQVGDGVAHVAGLPWTRLGELLRFEDGSFGLAFEVDAHDVSCVLLSEGDGIGAGTKVRGTDEVARVPVGAGLLGRVVDAMGRPLDEGPAIVADGFEPIERTAPAIVDRDPVTEPLMTGVTVVDAMVPLGRGQRELIIGDRKTGKTALAVDAVINQRNSDVVCIYAAIGQKSSTVSEIVAAVREHGAIDRCIFVVGEASAPPGAQWMTPYAACTMAEYFRDRGQHALIVFDDLTHHAIVYRQMSLLMRRPPGREAYPGDIFYIHSRLLERAAKLSAALGGGSLTALPIAETQAGNLSAYIPTNLISITDGQIFFEPKLFYEGQKPAVNVGLSVSRVGGKTQMPAIKAYSESLRLDYAQFVELETFTRLGTVVDERTRKRIEHGRRIRAILNQPQYAPLPAGVQTALLLAVHERLLDDLALDHVGRFKAGLANWLAENCAQTLARIATTGALDDAGVAVFKAAIARYVSSLAPGGQGEA